MKTSDFKLAKRTLTMAAALVLLGGVGAALPKAGYCDDSTYNMAPPISTDQDQSTDDTADTPSTVFNWQEVPANQPVPITRAVFDQGGYQLFDNVGETIVVKFKNNNLCVMKFAVSQNGTMYFVNSGTSPILYVPEDGYLENATVEGAKWYPFTPDFQPSTPVFLGIAPSWSDYVDVGWYPDMCCYGGYWCGTTVGFFEPTFGLVISFGDQRFDGWDGYIGYCDSYPPPFEIGIYHEDRYRFASRSYWGGRSFHGGGRGGYSGRPFPGGRSIGGSPGFTTQGRAFRGGTNPGEDRSFYRTGGGVTGGSHSEYGGGFRGAPDGGFNGGLRGGANRGFRGGSSGEFSGGARSDSGGGFHGGGPGGFGGGGSFHGGAPGGSNGGGDFRGGSGAIGGGGFQGGGGGGRHR